MATIFNPKYKSLPKQVDENTDKIKELENVVDSVVEEVGDLDENKQNTLVAGQNITLTPLSDETVRIDASGGGGEQTDVEVDGTSITSEGVANIHSMNGNYDGSTNKFATASDLTALGNTKQDILTIDTLPAAGSPNPVSSGGVFSELASKQPTLISGINLKTINNESLLGSGNLQIQDLTTDVEVDGSSITSGNVANIQSMNGNYNPQSNKFATASDLTALGAIKENLSNKVTSLSSASTDTQYPTAKCVYDLIGDVESLLQNINSGTGV